MALGVTDLAKAVDFYTALLGVAPSKTRDDYARFEPAVPSVNLSLNVTTAAVGTRLPQHFGIQVGDTDAVAGARTRMESAGYAVRIEEDVTCCYAVSTKAWIADPDGHHWEVFVTTDDDAPAAERAPEETPCCAPTCCT